MHFVPEDLCPRGHVLQAVLLLLLLYLFNVVSHDVQLADLLAAEYLPL